MTALASKNIDRARARHAQFRVEQHRAETETWRRGFAGITQSLPPAIRINGFAMALAHTMSSNGGKEGSRSAKDEHKGAFAALDTLADWLLTNGLDHAYPAASTGLDNASAEHLLARLVREDQDRYRAGMSEALAYLQWLKLLAKAIAPTETERGEEPEGGARVNAGEERQNGGG